MSARVLALSLSLLSVAATPPAGIPFKPQMLDGGASETAAVADINRDGRLDIVSGEQLVRGAALDQAQPSASSASPTTTSTTSAICRSTSTATALPDIASVTWFAGRSRGSGILGRGRGPWVEATINRGFNVEFAILADLNNDGRAHEILAQENGTGQAWYEIKDKGLGRSTSSAIAATATASAPAT